MFRKQKSEEEIKAKAKAKRKKRRMRKLFMLVVVGGGGAALAASKDLRSMVLDKLFGSEKEFSYTPPAGEDTPSEPEA